MYVEDKEQPKTFTTSKKAFEGIRKNDEIEMNLKDHDYSIFHNIILKKEDESNIIDCQVFLNGTYTLFAFVGATFISVGLTISFMPNFVFWIISWSVTLFLINFFSKKMFLKPVMVIIRRLLLR